MTTKIYEPLKLFFYASLINLILILIPSADNAFFDLLISFVGIAAGIISLYALYRMRDISSHLRGAFNFSVLSIIGMLVSLLFTVISTFNADSGFAFSASSACWSAFFSPLFPLSMPIRVSPLE